ncbi:cytochrome c3 family protein [Fimbriiglobus ruber]|uniref:Molybdopterin oxidoreductase subunit, chaperone protein HtpG n=1 Tax=Fimbriiglobus ruber TaxID=1908690 RepID=A0A225D3M2_9BACT|nr:cytochrome c3 family protein [Fimbriiglobus ruber]OWK36191.1 Molybdopterin oxidoreductase subunit, chaperone protein HtpG [Fimbriiglobus ruber]
MPQVFPKSMNIVARLCVLGLPLLAASGAVGAAAFYRSDYTTGAREVVEQPVPFSHKHHVAQLGIDCKYCHTAFETSASAGFPPTQTCMNCHQQMWQAADLLAPVRDGYQKNVPITWTKIHNVPDYTYFNHSIHVAKGVGCASCHGAIDDMNLVFQSKTLLMEWCLDCHRAPEKHLRPQEEVTNMAWKASDKINPATGKPYDQLTLGKELKEAHMVRNPDVITNCSICHR